MPVGNLKRATLSRHLQRRRILIRDLASRPAAAAATRDVLVTKMKA